MASNPRLDLLKLDALKATYTGRYGDTVLGVPGTEDTIPVWDIYGGLKASTFSPGDFATPADIAALSSVYQPLDSDLTAIAALSTTSFGRDFLTETNAASTLTTLGVTSNAQSLLGDADVPRLTEDNTWSGTNLFNDVVSFKGGSSGSQVLNIRYWDDTSDSDISGLISGAVQGSVLEGPESRHVVIGLRENDTQDSFSVVSGGGNFSSDSTYDTLALHVNAVGDLTIDGIFIEQGRSVQTIASGTITIADDAIGYVDTGGDHGMYGGIFIISGANLSGTFPQPNWAISYFDVGGSLAHVSVAHSAGVDFSSGSWGSVASVTDGATGIGVHANGYQIVNREGGSRVYTWYALGTY